MSKAIVTTTINPPTEALEKFAEIAERSNWVLIIVGDKKTPHDDYRKFVKEHKKVVYLDPDWQAEHFPELSKLLGWNCIQRRNIGLIHAWQIGAEIIATVDDDNIPHSRWGNDVKVGKVVELQQYRTMDPVFDPLSPVLPHLWHRGFPIQLLERKITDGGKVTRKVMVQADFWDGDPDVDAVCRIALKPSVRFKPGMAPFCSNKIAPFNSQNTFLHRDILPTYFLFPGIGRMDDIWAAYVTQFEFPDSVIFSQASVTQKRNDHDLVVDMKAEMIGYENNLDFVKSKNAKTPNAWHKFLPKKSLEAYEAYKRAFENQ